MNLEKLKPWNWFKKEQEERREQPTEIVRRQELVEPGLLPVLSLHRDIDRLFSNMLRATPLGAGLLGQEGLASLSPRMDISETDDAYLLEVDVPGMEPDNIQITVDDGVLRIRGERKQEKEDSKCHKVERVYGMFERVVSLPPDADEDDVKAKFSNGVLKLTVKKDKKAKSAAKTVAVESE